MKRKSLQRRNKRLKTHNESIIERCKDVGNTERMLPFSYSWPKGHIILLGFSGLLSRLHTNVHKLRRQSKFPIYINTIILDDTQAYKNPLAYSVSLKPSLNFFFPF